MSAVDQVEPESKNGMTFWDHLDELRGTLFRIIVTVGVGMIACFFLADFIRDVLVEPFNRAARHMGEGAGELVLLKPTEGFVVQLKIALFAGFILTCPVSFYHIWLFVAPGLHKNERRAALPFILVATLLFLVGVAFGYNVLSFATEFFLQFSSNEIANQWSLSSFIGFVTRMVLAFGIVFEMPLVIYVLARMGIVTRETLKKYRRHAAVGILALSALLTPPDPVSQLTLALPVYLLYEISLLVCAIVMKKEERKREEDESGNGTDDGNTGDTPPEPPEPGPAKDAPADSRQAVASPVKPATTLSAEEAAAATAGPAQSSPETDDEESGASEHTDSRRK